LGVTEVFTGIIAHIGVVSRIEKMGGDIRLHIDTPFDTHDVAIGASIACNGVCLTVIKTYPHSFITDVSAESIACSEIGSWQVGTKINLERALKVGDELGGRIVSGHVDGLAKLISIQEVHECYKLSFVVPDHLKVFVAAKGSVTLNGVSLTVNTVDDKEFSVNIVPHTWKNTTFHLLQPDQSVHFEVDMLARYMARYQEVLTK
jgi:riboflavin synthase